MTTNPYTQFLKIAGNVHLAYYVQAADKLGIPYSIVVRSLTARFETNGKPWFIINTVVPINNATSSAIAKRKNHAYKVMHAAGVPVAEQKELATEEEAITFFNQYKDIVIKPVRNLGGNGVSILPRSEEEVRNAFQLAQEKNLSDVGIQVLGEQFAPGTNYRVLVLDDKVIGVVKRRSAYVLGDGTRNIQQLIDEQNLQRKGRLLKPIKVDETVHRKLDVQGMNLESVPTEGQEVEVRFNSNLTSGGTTEECSAQLHPHYAQIAVDATKSLGLKLGGVDLIAPDITQPGPAVINEVNYNPGLRVHYKVDKGEVIDVALEIMKYTAEYFAG